MEGQEESSVISTSESNEESKRNMKEVRKAVCKNISNDINSVIITVACIVSSPDFPWPALNIVIFGYEIIKDYCLHSLLEKKIIVLGEEQIEKLAAEI